MLTPQRIAAYLREQKREALRRVYQRIIEELRPEEAMLARTSVTDPKGTEVVGAAIDEHVPAAHGRAADGDGAPGGQGAAAAIERALAGRTRGRWRSYPSWSLDHEAAPDAPRSRFAEADGVIWLNAQHPDYLAAKSAQLRQDPRPMRSAASVFACARAIGNCTPWFWPIGRPKHDALLRVRGGAVDEPARVADALRGDEDPPRVPAVDDLGEWDRSDRSLQIVCEACEDGDVLRG